MNSHDRERLLKEILPPDDPADFRRVSLEGGLAGLRREQRRRRIVRFSAAATALICVSLGVALVSRNRSENKTAQVRPTLATASLPLASHVEFIDDDQLLALFTNQPVALVGKPGKQRLVFLGNSENNSAEHPF